MSAGGLELGYADTEISSSTYSSLSGVVACDAMCVGGEGGGGYAYLENMMDRFNEYGRYRLYHMDSIRELFKR